MEPDPSSTTAQGGKREKRNKTGNTVPDSEIPRDNLDRAGIDEGPTEGALQPGTTEPATRHLNDRPERGVNRGLHS